VDEKSVLLLARAYAFAAERHVDQRRKSARREPYINHPTEVAMLVAEATDGRDPVVVAAAVLHDVLEDRVTEADHLAREFGEEIARIVRELTDDKSLPRDVRKRLQIENASRLSYRARLVGLADKIANLRSLRDSPPADWPSTRKRDYLDWSRRVVARIRGTHPDLERRFHKVAAQVEQRLAGEETSPTTALEAEKVQAGAAAASPSVDRSRPHGDLGAD